MATDEQLVCASTQTAHALSFSDMDALFEEFDTGDFPAFNPQFSITSKPSTVAVEVAAARAQELGVYVLAPGAAPAHASLRVDSQTTVGDIRAFIRDSLGVPLSCQRWLSLLRQPASGCSGSNALGSDAFGMTLTTMMLEDERTVESYGGLTPGAAVHASVDSAPASAPQPVTIAAATGTATATPSCDSPRSPAARLLPCALVLQPSGKIAATQRMQLAEAPAAAAACSAAVPSGCWEYTDEGTAASAQSLFEADLFTTHCAVAADPHHAAQDL